jgi:phenylalanyl-tRNA synthetase beta chain
MDQAGVSIPIEKLTDILSNIKCELKNQTDEEITVEVNSDRPDLFSSEGITRALRSYLNGSGPYSVKRYEGPPLKLQVDPSTAGVRPLIMCAAIRGISLTSEATKQFMQLQEKLHNTYASNRKKASIGVYDLDKVVPGFLYTALPADKISFIPLDCDKEMTGSQILETTSKGKDYAGILAGMERYPVLMDCRGNVLSMPPIINSEQTRVTEHSKNLFIDVTGLEDKAINTCLNIMVTSVLERGGSLQQVQISYPTRTITTPSMDRRLQRLSNTTVDSVSGLNLSNDETMKLLNRMGFQSTLAAQGTLEVEIPLFRVDILHEVDLVEDVIIAYGLNRMIPEVPKVMTMGRLLPGSRLRLRVRDLMVGSCFQEIASYVLSNREVMEDRPLLPKRQLVEIIKPISSEYTVLRDSILPKILQFLGCNTHIAYPQRLFEYGEVVG